MIALAIFVVGWALQYWGHYFEGMKPAFYDDVMGLAIGPLFVLAEAFFLFEDVDVRRHYFFAFTVSSGWVTRLTGIFASPSS